MSEKHIKIPNDQVQLTKSLILIMAIAVGISIANLYYLQPLLAEIAQHFHVARANISVAVTLTQIGYALGMFFVLPLADIFEKKRIILIMLGCSTSMLLFMAFSQNITMFYTASFLIGLTSVSPQLLIPLTAHLADPKNRGKSIGTVTSGLLVGVLFAQLFSGLIGQYLRWEYVYFIAFAFVSVLGIVLFFMLPESPAASKMRYSTLLKSIISLVKNLPSLRVASLCGALMFCAFNMYLSTLTFLLADHYHFGSSIAGLFGLCGLVGIFAAPLAGQLADIKGTTFTLLLSIGIIGLSYICLLLFGFQIAGLIIGVIILNFGINAGQTSNLAKIHSISDEARNRINMIYMVTYFIGGSVGSILGSLSYSKFGWVGVCVVGLLTQVVAIGISLYDRRNLQMNQDLN